MTIMSVDNPEALTDDLLNSYRNTTYWAITDTEYIPIRIDARGAQIDLLLRETGFNTWAFVTAANPYSRQQSPALNAINNIALRQDLDARGMLYYRGLGVADDNLWPPEDSYLVLDISVEDAVDLGKKHTQNAVVVGRVGEAARLALCRDGF